MERVAIPDVPMGEHKPAIETQDLASTLGAEHVAVNYYRIPPGEGLPSGLHAHADQEAGVRRPAGDRDVRDAGQRRGRGDGWRGDPIPSR